MPAYRRRRHSVSVAVVLSRLTTTALPLCLLAFLSACVGEHQPAAGDSEGASALNASDVHVVGTSDALARVQDLEVLADGTVWVLNSVEPLLIGFAPDGSVIRAHGRSGGGPEEFGRPAGFVVGGIAGDPWLFDWQRHTFVEVSDSAASRRELPIPDPEIPPGSVAVGMNLLSSVVRTGRIGDEIILPRADDGTAWLRPLDLERGGLDGGRTWLRVSQSGERDEVRLPERFDPYRFSAERIWGVQRDELDVASIAWVATPRGR